MEWPSSPPLTKPRLFAHSGINKWATRDVTSTYNENGFRADTRRRWSRIWDFAESGVLGATSNPDKGTIGELSGPRPLRRVADIVSKPRIWNRNAGIDSFEAHPTTRIMGGGKDRNYPPQAHRMLVLPTRPSFRFHRATLHGRP